MSKVLGSKALGAVVVGRALEGSWLALSDEPGFMRMVLRNGTVALEPRRSSYIKISHGRCKDLGFFPVVTTASCELAAHALGLPDANVSVLMPDVEYIVPEGCYLKDGKSLWITIPPFMAGQGATSNRAPICSTNFYPTTTTTSSTWTKGVPSLLCFAVMRSGTNEEALIKAQLHAQVGIFDCDEYIVISNELVTLGVNRTGGHVHTWQNPAPALPMGNLGAGAITNSWLNTEVFINAIDTILSDSRHRVWKYDWLVKLDPDAVFFPDRLREHLKDHTPSNVYFTNCNIGIPRLYGSIEVFSQQAMKTYSYNSWKCKQMNWHGWGEDSYFQKCMDAIGVGMVADYTLVGDARCLYAPCTDKWRAAFHPFKDVHSWFWCHESSTGSRQRE